MPSSLLKFIVDTSHVKIGRRKYKVVQIGNQLWLAENLEYAWDGLSVGGGNASETPHAWYYNNDKNTYGLDGTYKCGLLYNWYAMKYLDDNKDTLLPAGWHAPTYNETQTLFSSVGGTSGAGNKLGAKANSIVSGFPSWSMRTDDYEFAFLPTGYRINQDARFYEFNSACYLMTMYEASSTNFRSWKMSESSPSLYGTDKNTANPIRLVKTLT